MHLQVYIYIYLYIYLYLHVPARAQISTFTISCTMLEFSREMARHVRDFETSGSSQKKTQTHRANRALAMFYAYFFSLVVAYGAVCRLVQTAVFCCWTVLDATWGMGWGGVGWDVNVHLHLLHEVDSTWGMG